MQNAHTAEIIIGLLVGVAALVWLASKLRVPYPILLVLGGLGIALAPLPEVPLRPDLVFLLFLPPLLYHAALLTSWRDFRANLNPILLLAIGLVLATTALVAWVSHSLLGMMWPAAFALGAIISPPDAVAATSVMERLRIPKRIVTILEGESLVNDASALVIYTFAIAAAMTGRFSLPQASWQFVVVSAGGIAIGYAVGVMVCASRRRLKDNSVDTLVSLLTPYIAYLPAEWLHVSGVLAAVTAGLYVGRQLPRIISSEQRMRVFAVWEALVFLLNGIVFILIGLQLPSIIANIRADPSITVPRLSLYTLIIAAVTIGVRFAWVFTLALVRGWIDRRVTDRRSALHGRSLTLIGWSGMRGIVSLAAAIALPLSPEQFPHRDQIIFITFGMILITLVGQGLTLPLLIRKLHFEFDDHDEREEALARRELAFAALGRLEAMELIGEAPKSLIDEVRTGYELRVQRFNQRLDAEHELEVSDPCNTTIDVELEALEAERQVLIKLRDDGLIADEILRHIQHELDIAEVRLQAQRHSMEAGARG
jgi:CPA1 family monovalent cation:H+ antiporter